MSDNTVNQVLTDSVSCILQQYLLPMIIKFYETKKNSKATLEELTEWLELTPVDSPVSTTPSSRSASTKASGSQRAKKVGEHGTCEYKFTKGDNIDKLCGKGAIGKGPGGQNRCRACMTKGVSKKDKDGDDATPAKTTSKGRGSKKTPAESQTTPVQEEVQELDVNPIPEKDGYFKETKYNVLIEMKGDNVFYALGVMDGNDTENLKPIGEEAKVYLTGMGVLIKDQVAVNAAKKASKSAATPSKEAAATKEAPATAAKDAAPRGRGRKQAPVAAAQEEINVDEYL